MSSAFFDPDDYESVAIAAPVNRDPVLSIGQEKPKFFDLKPVATDAENMQLPAPIRMPEPLSLPSDFPTFVAPEGMNVDLSDLAIGSEEPLTRRQLREMQRLTGSDVINDAFGDTFNNNLVVEDSLETKLDYVPDLAEQLHDAAIESVEGEYSVAPATADDFSYMVAQAEPMFDVSPGLVIEPTTNSIIIEQVQDLTNYTATVNETGEILTTGAIHLPIELADNSTGEIQIIQDAASLDRAIQVDNSTGFINTIAPMRVTGVINAISKFKVIPTNLKRGSSHPYLVLAAAVGMAALGGLVLAAFMLQII